MPIKQCKLPDGGDGWQWGDSGKCYADRADAEKQAEAAHANGYAGDEALAFDKGPVENRTTDIDGHLHIIESNISKATVNPYIGREIPDWKELGLDGDRIYYLLRDPAELEKAADTFNGKPLLFKHRPVDAEDHAYETVVGAISNPRFVHPFLKSELVVWPGKAIDAIEDGSQKELSSGYRYRADMTPGVYEGQAYDGVMRDIFGNHVAMVKEGRAGPEVVVGDSNGEITMSKTVLSRKAAVAQGALLVYLRPKLAQDAKIDLTPILAKVTNDNFKASKPGIITALLERTKGKLAQDAAIDDAGTLLDSIEALNIAEDEEKEPEPKGEDEWDDEDDDDKKKAKDKKKGAKDADMDDDKEDDKDEEKQEPKAKDKRKGAKDGDPGDLVTKPAMDAQIAAAVKAATASAIKTQREIRDAERAIRPYVGELAMAHDSADAVYRTALDALGVKTDGINELVALKTILEMQPKASDQKAKPRVAMDASGAKSFADMFPDSARIRIM